MNYKSKQSFEAESERGSFENTENDTKRIKTKSVINDDRYLNFLEEKLEKVQF